MFQNQYYNSKLSKKHIEKLLEVYNIKYNTMKKEIDAKFDNMINLFVNDIRAFLENTEEIRNERKKIKEAENTQMEIEILKSKLEEKSINENKMKNEIDNLTKENSSLRTRIKIQSNISKSKNNFDVYKTNSTILRPERKKTNQFAKISNGGKIITNNKDKTNLTKNRTKTDKYKNRNNNNLSLSMERRNNKDNDITKSGSIQHKNNKKSNSIGKRNVKPFTKINIKQKIKNKNRKNNSLEKTPDNKSFTANTTENVTNSNINTKKNKTIENDDKNLNTLEINPFDQSFGEDESILTVDDVIDEEIKELEIDEENIISLMEQIKNLGNDIKENIS